MFRRIILCQAASLLLSVVGALKLAAQSAGLSGPNIVINHISSEQGLSDRTVWAITQDRQGFIWFGTQNGLNRFDGRRCTVFKASPDSTGLTDSFVWCLYPDRDGSLWVGTNTGLNRFDPSTGTFRKYLQNPLDSTSLTQNEVRAIYRDRTGTLWVGTKVGLNRFEERTGTWTRFFASPEDSTRPGDNFIKTILEDRQGNFWLGSGNLMTNGGGLFLFDRTSGTVSRSRLGPDESFGDVGVNDDSSGALWIFSGGAHRRDPVTGIVSAFPLPPSSEWPQATPGAMCEDGNGALWFSAWGAGLYRYDKATKEFSHFFPDPLAIGSLASANITAMFVDRAGLLWIGTANAGVNTISTKPFLVRHSLANSLRLFNGALNLFTDRDGNLWISDGPRVWHYDVHTGKATKILQDIVANAFYQDKTGAIWFSTVGTLARYEPRTKAFKRVWYPPNLGSGVTITSLCIDSQGLFWVGLNEGLYRITGDMKKSTYFPLSTVRPSTIYSGRVNSIYEDRQGSIWVATATGLYRFEDEKQSFTRFTHDERDSSSLSNDICGGPIEDRHGELWVYTASGLDRFNPTTSNFTRCIHQPVWNLVADQKGLIWMFSARGLLKFDPASRETTTVDPSDGLPAEGVSGPSALLKSGEIVFGTKSGILVFHPDSVRPLGYVPPVVISGIKMFDRPVHIAALPELVREITLAHDENVFSIEYAALSYDMPEYNQYAYKLEGFDREWVYCGNGREAKYTNLDPGTYTFRVKGSNHDGIWNEAGAALTVIIKPAFWQTWWFRLGSLLALLGGGLFVYRREVTRLRKEKRVQEEFSQQLIEVQEVGQKRLAADLHDGLGQDLLVASNELQQFLEEKNLASQELNQVAALLQDSIDNVREIASNLHPHQLDRLGFRAAIDSMTENLSRVSRLAIDRSCDNIDDVMPKEVEIHVYRIIQEALANVVRHASAKNVNLQVRKTSGSIEVTVTDDGKGFDMGEAKARKPSPQSPGTPHGFGLSSMSERARIIGATLTIESAPGFGTTVHMSVPST